MSARDEPEPWAIDWVEPDRDVHHAGVLACLEAIAAGEVYQACVCTQYVGALRGMPFYFFADMVARTAPARAAFVAGDWGAVASLSPDCSCVAPATGHVESDQGHASTGPPAAALRASVKDVAENIMIVDLVRNDLSRVALTGTVTVPELLAVRRAPGVWHLVSTVSARVAVDVSNANVLAATFPPGVGHRNAEDTGSGATVEVGAAATRSLLRHSRFRLAGRRRRAQRRDPHRRVRRRGHAVLGVGGGITADSNPDAEWQECLHKAAPIIGSFASAGPHRRAHAATGRRDWPRSPRRTHP